MKRLLLRWFLICALAIVLISVNMDTAPGLWLFCDISYAYYCGVLLWIRREKKRDAHLSRGEKLALLPGLALLFPSSLALAYLILDKHTSILKQIWPMTKLAAWLFVLLLIGGIVIGTLMTA